MKRITAFALCCLMTIPAVALAQRAIDDDAAKFGEQEAVFSAALSADGTHIVFIGPDAGSGTIAEVADLTAASIKQVAKADGQPLNLNYCDWSAADRLVCTLSGITRLQSVLYPVSRTMAIDSDGSHSLPLGQRNTLSQEGVRLGDGYIVDWLNGVDGMVLMERSNIAESTTGKLTARTKEGLGVDRIDTRTGKATEVERPGTSATNFISDGLGNIRLMTTTTTIEGYLKGVETHFYRTREKRDWEKLGVNTDMDGSKNPDSIVPLAVDPIINAAYVLQRLDGRQALYRIALDGSMKKELVFASRLVDVEDVIRVGRGGRVIGASYVTERRQIEYFDEKYKGIATMLGKAQPRLPLISFISASADEQVQLVWMGSDVDAGHYYVFDQGRKVLREVHQSRPGLKGKALSQVRTVTYTAGDGTQIPAYLTLPPGVTEAKGLPAIVMPHGGPASRDEWGFDWLSQYFAQRGYAVLQPNFRGSSGYGDDWFVDNGFRSWKVSIGDVCDGARWLAAQGIADPSKLAAFGWSYGGYAVLQANVLDPNLFKAVVAVAPVTDLALLKTEAHVYGSAFVEERFIGEGPHVAEGSPAQNAAAFKAPVLMLHGEMDLNVDIDQSRKMDKELRGAGKSSQLVVYPKLEHSLRDGTVRADMLRKSDAFLRDKLKL
jgi:dipeptidyl aminopeptidase/acylaminoacyl peptidase